MLKRRLEEFKKVSNMFRQRFKSVGLSQWGCFWQWKQWYNGTGIFAVMMKLKVSSNRVELSSGTVPKIEWNGRTQFLPTPGIHSPFAARESLTTFAFGYPLLPVYTSLVCLYLHTMSVVPGIYWKSEKNLHPSDPTQDRAVSLRYEEYISILHRLKLPLLLHGQLSLLVGLELLPQLLHPLQLRLLHLKKSWYKTSLFHIDLFCMLTIYQSIGIALCGLWSNLTLFI